MNVLKFTTLFLLLVFMSRISVAQRAENMIRQLDSAGIHLYQGVDYKVFEEQVKRNPGTWKKAVNFLRDKDRLNKISPGRYDLDGDSAYVKISDGPTKASQDVQWESHRKYIDLQYVISGKEQMFVAKIDSLQLTKPYDEAADVAHYSGAGNSYIATPRQVFLFFPDDAHRTGIHTDGCDTSKKLVIKLMMK